MTLSTGPKPGLNGWYPATEYGAITGVPAAEEGGSSQSMDDTTPVAPAGPSGPGGPQQLLQAYLDAFSERDTPRCLTFFTPDATVDFMSHRFEGIPAIEQWHNERFAADLRVLRVDGFRQQGASMAVDIIVASRRLKVWKLDSLAGRAQVRFEQGKIAGLKFGVRAYNPFQGF